MGKSKVPKKQSSLHPLLRELHLWTPTNKGTDGTSSSMASTTRATPLDVLNYLLHNQEIKEDVLRSAVSAVQEQKEADAKANKTIDDHASSKRTQPQHRTRHIALRFSYDGANYNGLAQNIGQESDNSVERALFQALVKARLVESRETSGYSRCGRTDRGVSAAGQVVAMQLKSAIPLDASLEEEGTQLLTESESHRLPKNEHDSLEAWVIPRKRAKKGSQSEESSTQSPAARVKKVLTEYPYAKILNNLLPPTIRVLGWAPVSDEFSARFSATTRTYRYFFVKRQLDLSKMFEALGLLKGKHDFRNFCKMDVEKVYNFERVIHDARLFVQTHTSSSSQTSDAMEFATDSTTNGTTIDSRDTCYVQIHGQAFLWHQIRCIMEVLFMIGNGLEEPSIITELVNVEKYPGKPAYNLAPERPLVLNDCGYPNLQVGHSVQNVWTVTCQLEQQWEELILAAARIRNSIEGFRGVSLLVEDLLEFVNSKLTERTKKQTKMGLVVTHRPIEIPESILKDDGRTLNWKDALPWLESYQLVPDATGLNTSIHVPLLKRGRGTTYEQKIESLKKSTKRRQKFEENVIKKRKSAEEDAAFYKHKTKQGGTGL